MTANAGVLGELLEPLLHRTDAGRHARGQNSSREGLERVKFVRGTGGPRFVDCCRTSRCFAHTAGAQSKIILFEAPHTLAWRLIHRSAIGHFAVHDHQLGILCESSNLIVARQGLGLRQYLELRILAEIKGLTDARTQTLKSGDL